MPSPLLPMAKPAKAHMVSTSSLTTTNTSPVSPARTGREGRETTASTSVTRCGGAGSATRRSRSAMSANPRTTRSQDAQVGGELRRPPSASEDATKTAVSAARPSSQPPRKARLVGRGRGVCNTSTAGMTDNGETAMTSASGISVVSTEPQLPVTGCIFALPGEVRCQGS